MEDVTRLINGNNCAVIMDSAVYNLFPGIADVISRQCLLLLSAGEETKTLEIVKNIYDFLVNCKIGRSSLVFVIGGGTITDVAAYAVSSFKRGCRLSLIPTTLLGMIDAAIGGKTAINFGSAKNLIGSFYPAHNVLIVPDFLKTLPEKELKNGLAEMLKLRFIIPKLTELPQASRMAPDAGLIMEYAKAKLTICEQDPYDLSNRRMLNLGHTFGHVLESYTNYSYPHGEAVIWGIAVAAGISCKLQLIDNNTKERIISILLSYGFQTTLDAAMKSDFLKAFPLLINHDKKGQDNKLALILFNADHQTIIRENIPVENVVTFLPDCI